MNERLLHYIWQFQYFNQTELHTSAGEAIRVLSPGIYNTNQGPDFLQARVQINETVWAGNIELHVVTSDWDRHRHAEDTNYENVILHVVWKHDTTTTTIPLLELEGRVPGLLLQRYQQLLANQQFIPCENQLAQIDTLCWQNWKDRLVIERLERKAATIKGWLEENRQDWEQTAWWSLARSFGAGVNGDAFEALARSIDIHFIQRHHLHREKLEAILLGQAGLLMDEHIDAYPKMLQEEYEYHRHKLGIRPVFEPFHFLRMRPGNFPTIRLAQLAAFLHLHPDFFNLFRNAASVLEISESLQVEVSAYWQHHYRPDEKATVRGRKTGTVIITTILINTVVPLLYTYGNNNSDQAMKERAGQWLDTLDPETHHIARAFAARGIPVCHASDTQALLELKTFYCNAKRCLDCMIGNRLLTGLSVQP